MDQKSLLDMDFSELNKLFEEDRWKNTPGGTVDLIMKLRKADVRAEELQKQQLKKKQAELVTSKERMVLEEITQTRDYTGTFKEGTERCARQNEINNKIIEEVSSNNRESEYNEKEFERMDRLALYILQRGNEIAQYYELSSGLDENIRKLITEFDVNIGSESQDQLERSVTGKGSASISYAPDRTLGTSNE